MRLLTEARALRGSLLISVGISVASLVYILFGPAKVNLILIVGSALLVIATGLGARAISTSANPKA